MSPLTLSRKSRHRCLRCGRKARKKADGRYATTCEHHAAIALQHTHRWRPLKKESSWHKWPEDEVTG